MSEQPETPGQGAVRAAPEGGEQHVCRFPQGIGEDGEFVVHGLDMSGEKRPGRRADYCGRLVVDPDGVQRKHDRMTAFTRRRELQLAAAGGAVTPRREGPARPVTSARASLTELLDQWQGLVTAQRTQFGDLADRIAAIVSAAGDPDAAVAEVAAARRDADEEIRSEQQAREEADAAAREARRELARALEATELAEATAQDALEDRDAQVNAANAARDAALADAAAAREELQTVQAAADERVAATKREALAEVEAAQKEAKNLTDLAVRNADERVARHETAKNEALSAQHQAEAARAAADPGPRRRPRRGHTVASAPRGDQGTSARGCRPGTQ